MGKSVKFPVPCCIASKKAPNTLEGLAGEIKQSGLVAVKRSDGVTALAVWAKENDASKYLRGRGFTSGLVHHITSVEGLIGYLESFDFKIIALNPDAKSRDAVFIDRLRVISDLRGV